ncbi:heavy metal RND efflux outer membrane protein, CzcC family (plasmid) [Phenylobacterium zucineum HLK1]|uniref:Heavy metal RND efflux outer membrane protein, CzcC family n=1 Tax=Phenylobacterium zucineum (strain HLK1) TaxID=450851 RepID=B4RIJ1_PHEZH|nr:TolC family protein [Phenylobacterium zucineum]ACG80166.1 heavy metal RND efflux outer membrane protein, CzcC family [Phenylobacterium zucineum HLK1]
MPPLKWLCPLIIGGAAAASAHAGPLTFDEAVARADQSAPAVQAANLRVRGALAAAPAAGQLPDPRLSFGLENAPVSGPMAGRMNADEMTMARVGVMQELPNRAKRQARSAVAQAGVGAAQASRDQEALEARLGAALAWLDLHYARRRLSALADVEASLEPLWKTLPARLAAGSARPGETVEADQWRAELADQRSELRAAEARARAELARWVGDPAAEAEGPPPAFAIDGAALAAGMERHPALREAAAERVRAEAELAAARADKRPDWAVEAAYQRRDPAFGDMVSVGVTVSLPLFAKRRQDPVVAGRVSDLAAARAQTEAARLELEARLKSELADYDARRERLGRAREALLPLARKRADLEVASYAAGSTGLAEVLMAFDSLADAKLDEIAREAELARVAARLALTYGTPAP